MICSYFDNSPAELQESLLRNLENPPNCRHLSSQIHFSSDI